MSLRIVVCVKYVPDATGDRGFTEELTTDREGVDGLLSELDEHAVEQALRIAENTGDTGSTGGTGGAGSTGVGTSGGGGGTGGGDGTEITVLTMGPEDARDALRKALSMGADKAVHIEDDDLHGTDALGTSLVLARAAEHIGYDLVVCGMASTDGGMGVLPAMLAERLGVPQATLLSEVRVEDGRITGRREGDTATELLETALPAVVSVTDLSGEARYPSFKGIMAAKKKPMAVLTLSDLGIEAEEVGLRGAWTAVDEATERPVRTAGTIVEDEGDGGRKLAEFLAGQKFV
ncbi:electron transfer flavoprotein beta subunit/FixA family protein [Streptomyces sp. ICN441]|uniref:Electron transfer flavoprotein subunit beta n=1 Tax=Streptomyces tirandamycinicus TaxID=2174846 RepID=A0A2S1ST66_9ACTN|nr:MULTISPECIES: electron transfer flavoprotein subunit beta/FixA family protein [Streptomyces]AWI29570.1 electron transfer flavoprotein subunit beta [Streptomyces tirandamycinicus]TFE48167.1 electron transfer flavoprotein beta subunit/FixA family protein [Streptomyces sp. ICN441]